MPVNDMLAAVPDERDGSVDLVHVPVPEPAPGEAVVEIRAAAMNRADLLHARGRYTQALRPADRPNIAGMEFAGRVIRVGPHGDPALVGAEVMAMFPGAYAEQVAVDARLLMPAPAELTWAERAALPMGLLTEFDALTRLAETRGGDRVLVTGATSGVGLIGVQLARQLSAGLVVGTSRNSANDSLITGHGADIVAHGVDELASTAPDGFDVVVDHVGGELLEACVGLLRPQARAVSVGRLGGKAVCLDLAAFSARRASLVGTTWKSRGIDEVAECVAAACSGEPGRVTQGDLRPTVAKEFALEDIAGAYELLAGDRPPGKLVIVPPQPKQEERR